MPEQCERRAYAAVDAHLTACPRDASGEQRDTGGQEAAVPDPGAVDMSVRPDEYIVTDNRRMPRQRASGRQDSTPLTVGRALATPGNM